MNYDRNRAGIGCQAVGQAGLRLGTCRILGLGGHLPEQVLTNTELAQRFGVTPEWIASRTGIRERRILPAGQNASDMGVLAARAALADSGVAAGAISHLLVASCTPDGLVPNTACTLEHKLGLFGLVAMDFNVACSGFLYGLYLGAGILRLEPEARILLVATEAMSRLCAPGERNVNVIFGDGAGAAVLGAGTGAGLVLGDILLGSDGRQGDLLTADGGGSRAAYASPDSRVGEAYFLRMRGGEVFRQAVCRMSQACLTLLARNGLSVDDIDLFVPHQANGRIIEAIGERIGLGPDRTVVTLGHCGNTSAASIPLALAETRQAGLIRPGQRILLAAFGAGFTWGAALLRVEGTRAP
ncbi:MAG: beta-ketoacyl-ACP synthase 3 [Solidesulfovibrio sp. DCME]|uniref:beta-ketoacyl-ACP synthase 3 n=1 Tax=Solidesulfovibrio sp. DCME TaxID=3447380 RepID=UPI003D0F6B5A